MDKKKKLIIVAVAWFLFANVFFAIFGSVLVPSGGIDSIGTIIVYVFLWRMFMIIPPIIMFIVVGSMFLREKSKKAFKYTVIAIIAIIGIVILYQTVGKQFILTPRYMATHAETFAEYKSRANEYEKEHCTAQDDISNYVSFNLSRIFSKATWADTEWERSKYVLAFFKKHQAELPNIENYRYIDNIHKITGEPKFSYINVSDGEDTDKILEYSGADKWCTNHVWNLSDMISHQQVVLLYYTDGTIDAVDINPHLY